MEQVLGSILKSNYCLSGISMWASSMFFDFHQIHKWPRVIYNMKLPSSCFTAEMICQVDASVWVSAKKLFFVPRTKRSPECCLCYGCPETTDFWSFICLNIRSGENHLDNIQHNGMMNKIHLRNNRFPAINLTFLSCSSHFSPRFSEFILQIIPSIYLQDPNPFTMLQTISQNLHPFQYKRLPKIGPLPSREIPC